MIYFGFTPEKSGDPNDALVDLLQWEYLCDSEKEHPKVLTLYETPKGCIGMFWCQQDSEVTNVGDPKSYDEDQVNGELSARLNGDNCSVILVHYLAEYSVVEALCFAAGKHFEEM